MPEAAEGDGGYIHPLPLQVLAAGKSECALLAWLVDVVRLRHISGCVP
jgi:hypothetical protein